MAWRSRLASELAWVPKPLLFRWLTMTRTVLPAGVVIGAVTAEDEALVVGVVDVAVDPGDLLAVAGEDADVNASVVLAVNEHDVVGGDSLLRLRTSP